MAKKITLTENELIALIEKVVKEQVQGEDPVLKCINETMRNANLGEISEFLEQGKVEETPEEDVPPPEAEELEQVDAPPMEGAEPEELDTQEQVPQKMGLMSRR